jgi:TatD DNase family protein
VPLDRMLIETDSPYLAPIPYRGKINEPAWVSKVGEFIADLKGVSIETLGKATSNNFFNCFQVDRALT